MSRTSLVTSKSWFQDRLKAAIFSTMPMLIHLRNSVIRRIKASWNTLRMIFGAFLLFAVVYGSFVDRCGYKMILVDGEMLSPMEAERAAANLADTAYQLKERAIEICHQIYYREPNKDEEATRRCIDEMLARD